MGACIFLPYHVLPSFKVGLLILLSFCFGRFFKKKIFLSIISCCTKDSWQPCRLKVKTLGIFSKLKLVVVCELDMEYTNFRSVYR